MSGLNIDRIVDVNVNLSPVAAQQANIDCILILGDSSNVPNPVTVEERVRAYSSIEDIITDYGVESPEYAAALVYYSQMPKPLNSMIGRWDAPATHGSILGAALTDGEAAYANFKDTKAAFKIAIDGAGLVEVNENTSAATTLQGVLDILNAASEMTGKATITWSSTTKKFTITSTATGATSAIDYLAAPAVTEPAALNLAPLLKMTSATGAVKTAGRDAETARAAVAACIAASSQWYGLAIGSTGAIDNTTMVNIGKDLEAATRDFLFSMTTQEAGALTAGTSDLVYLVKTEGLTKSFVQFSNSSTGSKYAAASILGRFFSVDFEAQNAAIDIMFKKEPGVAPETLTEAQANYLKGKYGNVYAKYNNDTSFVQYGTTGSGAYIDEIYNLAWFKTALQTALFNAFYQAATKIPQTDAGENFLVTTAAKVCSQGVFNGVFAPGTWDADLEFGTLKSGQYLKSGFYIYAPLMSSQSSSDRAARKMPPLQIAVKMAGSGHSVTVNVYVNR